MSFFKRLLKSAKAKHEQRSCRHHCPYVPNDNASYASHSEEPKAYYVGGGKEGGATAGAVAVGRGGAGAGGGGGGGKSGWTGGGGGCASTRAGTVPLCILSMIFSYVCPHALDESYTSAEESTTEEGCMLCNMRDLSRVSLVCERWHQAAQALQYRSIRLDSVHYCGREADLQAHRKRGSFFQKQPSAMEISETRMRLLYRTFQENECIAMMVWCLKMPFMTRETCKQELAMLVSLLPNLQYVDLPEGVYQDEPSCASLKAILYTRCPDLRKMSWTSGSERNFVDLWMEPPWLSLETIELSEMKLENVDLVRVLSSLPNLQELKTTNLPWTTDEVFDSTVESSIGLFPPLQSLILQDMPHITISGITTYLTRPLVSCALQSLSLTRTSIAPHLLQNILNLTPSLQSLSIIDTVSRSIPQTPLLTSHSLITLHYELTDCDSSRGLAKPSPSYYSYLSESLYSNRLPGLKNLYVREETFHTRLQISTSRTLRQKINIFTKSADHMDWFQYVFDGVAGFAAAGVGGGRGRDILIAPVFIGGPNRNSVASEYFPPSPGLGSFLEGGIGGGGGGERERRGSRGSRQDLWR